MIGRITAGQEEDACLEQYKLGFWEFVNKYYQSRTSPAAAVHDFYL